MLSYGSVTAAALAPKALNAICIFSTASPQDSSLVSYREIL
jgi:hypothetical protein